MKIHPTISFRLLQPGKQIAGGGQRRTPTVELCCTEEDPAHAGQDPVEVVPRVRVETEVQHEAPAPRRRRRGLGRRRRRVEAASHLGARVETRDLLGRSPIATKE